MLACLMRKHPEMVERGRMFRIDRQNGAIVSLRIGQPPVPMVPQRQIEIGYKIATRHVLAMPAGTKITFFGTHIQRRQSFSARGPVRPKL
jgi:hypothetical protein